MLILPRSSDVLLSCVEEAEDTVGTALYREMISKYQDFFNSLFFEQPRQHLLCECIVDGMMNCSDLSPKFLKRSTHNTWVELTASEAAQMTFQILAKQKEVQTVCSIDNKHEPQVKAFHPTPSRLIVSPMDHDGITLPSATANDTDGDDISLSPLPIEYLAGEVHAEKGGTSPANSIDSSLKSILMSIWMENKDESYQNSSQTTGGDESLQNTEEGEDLTPLPFFKDAAPAAMNLAELEITEDKMDTDDDTFIENSDDLTPFPFHYEISIAKLPFTFSAATDTDDIDSDEVILASEKKVA
mmetsp:Transcript_25535/g.38715  ORF Transcript_25535/g.38715 Transcript_25535/m.38715 type:complete len:300 (+) Transcript_25535:239-1138(+)|eukprot:CAMPEP_0178916760 /NCGR_PEP_ID=MMETSP0786-20121207/12839_1 /TAXON_ID=186022 /ORGANISM="Thalassionema frauenfeldii, Strain CCMP 1798" /LENGTH=299 /DNA_ID=CAMNT_0020590173 /DNA_START=196 /DNA_END=1095 /DNA_ORIENTATION=-